MKKSFLTIFILFLAAVLAVFLYAVWQVLPMQLRAPKELFVVSKNFSEAEIIGQLAKKGFIKNEEAFRWALKQEGGGGKIVPGGYYISKGMSAISLAEILAAPPVQKWVTLPEGLRKEESADILQKELGWDDRRRQEFLDSSKEGYVFPETYLLDAGLSGKEISGIMSDQFNEEFSDQFEKYSGGLSLEEVVTLASLVQRESRNAREMPLVAGIILNRLGLDMKLDIDAALQYQLGTSKDWWPQVSSADKSVDSGYNTYLRKGLPVAPICDPGIAALNAVLLPQENDYLYYLHDSSGAIHCAKTYQEHLSNINKYLRSL
ncbi:MAG: endolytic transglycosylase MltG [Candidatus Paceibacterota bacterium]|jgi:UPF0755 protein